MPPPPPPPPPFPPEFGGSSPAGAFTQQHPKGTQILVLGIASIVCCYPLGIVAFFMAQNARKEMVANPGITYTNSSSVTAGWVMGIIAIALFVFGAIYYATLA